jgi:hypothetical protein
MSFFPAYLPAPKYSFSQMVCWCNVFDTAILFGKVVGCCWDSDSNTWVYHIEIDEDSPYSSVYADSWQIQSEDNLDDLSPVEIKELAAVR